MKKILLILSTVIMSCCHLHAQTPIYDSTLLYDVVTEADSFYLFPSFKPCFTPGVYDFAPMGWLLQQYVPTSTVTVYGVAIPLRNDRGAKTIDDTLSQYRAMLTTRKPSPYGSSTNPFYSMTVIDSVTFNRSHPRFCWFRYEDSCDIIAKVLEAPCYELYFDTPMQVNLMSDTFYVGRYFGFSYGSSVPSFSTFYPTEFGGEYSTSLPGTLYLNSWGFEEELRDRFNPCADRRWGVFFPIIGFRCKPVQSYWLDSSDSTPVVLRWRGDGQDTLFNVRLVGEDGSDTTFVTTDTLMAFTHLSDSVRYSVMLRKQCRYCTSNYDTIVYSDWTPELCFNSTILPDPVTPVDTLVSGEYILRPGNTLVITPGDTLIIGGDTLVNTGDTLIVNLGVTVIIAGQPFVFQPGDTLVAGPGDTLFVSPDGIIIISPGSTVIVNPGGNPGVGVQTNDMLYRYTAVSPNPATGRATVTSSFGLSRIDAFDAQGRLIASFPDLHAYRHTLDTQAWPRGACLLRIHTPLGTTTKKLLLQ